MVTIHPCSCLSSAALPRGRPKPFYLCIATQIFTRSHRLHGLLEVQHFLEADAAVGAVHLPHTPATHKLIGSLIHIGVGSENVIAQILFHRHLVEIPAYTLCKVICDANEYGGENLGQECTGILGVQIAQIELHGFFDELALAFTAITPVGVLNLPSHRGGEKDGCFLFSFDHD